MSPEQLPETYAITDPPGLSAARYDPSMGSNSARSETAHAGPSQDPELNTLLARARSRLQERYGDRLDSVILHGSVARGTQEAESDVDLLVLLRGELDYFRELRALVDLLYPLQLEAERVISALPAAADDYRGGTLQLYRNAAQEGVAL